MCENKLWQLKSKSKSPESKSPFLVQGTALRITLKTGFINSSFILVSSEYLTSFWRTKGLFGKKSWFNIVYTELRLCSGNPSKHSAANPFLFVVTMILTFSLWKSFKIKTPWTFSIFISGLLWLWRKLNGIFTRRNISFDGCFTN